MVVEFSVKNFRSIRDLQTVSFAATGLKSPKGDEYAYVDTNNIDEDGGMRIMKTIGIYGANGSGKSNLIKALEFFLQIIKNEASSESNLNFLCDPFLFQENALEQDSFFQMVLVIDNKKYRYGFTVKKNPYYLPAGKQINEKSKEIIVSEWLYGTKENNMGKYFTRVGSTIEKENIPNADNIPPIPYEHALFLTHASAFDSAGVCAAIRSYISGWTISNFEGLDGFRYSSLSLLRNSITKISFLNLLSSFNLKYDDVRIETDKKDDVFNLVSLDKIIFTKSFIDKNNEARSINLNLSHHESSGTQKLFDIAGLLLVAFSLDRSVFIILDEVDSNFHPSLLIKLIGLFNDPQINKNKSQLLFTSHDTNLMNPSIMRRDQFYFTEKRADFSTRLYSLADLKGIRNDADFSRDYLKGLYGGLPILEDYSENNVD